MVQGPGYAHGRLVPEGQLAENSGTSAHRVRADLPAVLGMVLVTLR
jgi:hypothetical protein